jgi:hypothetical protein
MIRLWSAPHAVMVNAGVVTVGSVERVDLQALDRVIEPTLPGT